MGYGPSGVDISGHRPDIRGYDWDYKRHIYSLFSNSTFYCDSWHVSGLSWHRAVVVRREPDFIPNRRLCMDWIWHAACRVVYHSGNPVPVHYELHGLWQAHLRNRLE